MLRTEITKSHLNNHICQHRGMKTSTVTPSSYYVFNISLYCYDTIPSFIGNLWRVLLLGNHLKNNDLALRARSLFLRRPRGSGIILYLKKKRTNSIPTPEELVCMFFKWAAPSDFFNYAVLPYIINGIFQPLTRLVRKHDIRVVNKPLKTLQQEFPSPKSRPPIDLQPNVVYKISCADCPWSYIGETGRCFETRRKEHMRNVKSYARGSNIAKHAWSAIHSIDFNNSQVIDKGSSRIRKTLESWHTASIDHADNNSRPLPNQYSIPLKKEQLTLTYIFFSLPFYIFFLLVSPFFI